MKEARNNAARLAGQVAKQQKHKAPAQQETQQREREDEMKKKQEIEQELEGEEKRRQNHEVEKREAANRQREDVARGDQPQDEPIVVSNEGIIHEELDVGSNVVVLAPAKSSRNVHASSNRSYSPEISLALQGSPVSVAKKSSTLLPSRLVTSEVVVEGTKERETFKR